MAGGKTALLQNHATGKGVLPNRSESLGEEDGGKRGATGEDPVADLSESLGEVEGGE